MKWLECMPFLRWVKRNQRKEIVYCIFQVFINMDKTLLWNWSAFLGEDTRRQYQSIHQRGLNVVVMWHALSWSLAFPGFITLPFWPTFAKFSWSTSRWLVCCAIAMTLISPVGIAIGSTIEAVVHCRCVADIAITSCWDLSAPALLVKYALGCGKQQINLLWDCR